MHKTTLVIIVFISGLIFGALVLNLWSAETSPFKAPLPAAPNAPMSSWSSSVAGLFSTELANLTRSFSWLIAKFLSFICRLTSLGSSSSDQLK